MNRSLTQPALIGGLFAGLLSALPLISAGNVCCCLWVVSGGAIATYLLQQNQAAPVTAADGALVGLMAGLVGAGIYLVVSIPISILIGPMEQMLVQRFVERMGNMPPEFREFAQRRTGSAIALVIGFVFFFVISIVFSTIGGLIGSVLFAKKTPPGTAEIPPA